MLSFSFACEQVSNEAQILSLECGADSEKYGEHRFIKIIDSNGGDVAPSDLSGNAVIENGQQAVSFTSKGCALLPVNARYLSVFQFSTNDALGMKSQHDSLSHKFESKKLTPYDGTVETLKRCGLFAKRDILTGGKIFFDSNPNNSEKADKNNDGQLENICRQ